MNVPKADLSFVSDSRVLDVLTDYYSQAFRAFEAASYIGSIVACGAVAEGLLTWSLSLRAKDALASPKAPKDRTGQVMSLEYWSLPKLIEIAGDLGLIGKTASQASWALKDFRNFIHPYNLMRQSARPDESLAVNTFTAVGEIARSLKGRLGS